jgi:hypothetical protein
MYKFRQTIPVVKIHFNDNPYLLKDIRKYDYYSIDIPISLFIKDSKNFSSLHVYSIFDDIYKYQENKEVLKEPINHFYDKIKHLFDRFTINNQNINIKAPSSDGVSPSLKIVYKDSVIYNHNHIPMYIYPEQQKINQYNNSFKVVKSPYDIKTLLTYTNGDQIISDIYKKMDTIELSRK